MGENQRHVSIRFDGIANESKEKAIAFNRGRTWFWIPRSQIAAMTTEGDHVLVTIPKWLALDKGLA